MGEWADGEIHATSLARLAKSAKRDGLDIGMNNNFANCGSDALHNCSKDLKHLLEASGAFDHVTPAGGDFFEWCISPCEVIKLLTRRESTFKKHLCPSVETSEMFWRDLFSTEEGMEYKQLHPHLKHKTVDQLKTSVALRTHEDAGPYSKVKGMNVVSWSSLHGRGIDLETKYPALTTVPSKDKSVACSIAHIGPDSTTFELKHTHTQHTQHTEHAQRRHTHTHNTQHTTQAKEHAINMKHQPQMLN